MLTFQWAEMIFVQVSAGSMSLPWQWRANENRLRISNHHQNVPNIVELTPNRTTVSVQFQCSCLAVPVADFNPNETTRQSLQTIHFRTYDALFGAGVIHRGSLGSFQFNVATHWIIISYEWNHWMDWKSTVIQTRDKRYKNKSQLTVDIWWSD